MSIRCLCLFIIALFFVGCQHPQLSSEQEYPGLYQYVSPPGGEHLSLPWLRLNPSGDYVAFEKTSEQQNRVLKRGRWKLLAGNNSEIILDGNTYPVVQKGSGFRIVLNDDRGQYYDKVK
jgi:hypothetical protein